MAGISLLREGKQRMDASRIMLALAAGTTLAGTLGFTALAGLVDSSDDLEDEAKSDAIQVVVILARVWLLSSAITGVLAIRAILQSHLPTLRLFAIHAIIDTILGGLTVSIFILATAFSSGDVSSSLGHAVCEHLSRGDAWGLVSSPGSGMELCEDRWNYGTAPMLMLLGCIGLFIRSRSAFYIYQYYQRIALSSNEGKISLGMGMMQEGEHDLERSTGPSFQHSNASSSSVSSAATATGCSSNHHHHSHHDHHAQHAHRGGGGGGGGGSSSRREGTRPRTNTTTSSSSSSSSNNANTNSNSKHSHSHSRSSSSSTVRPFRSATASRIMLLPADYQGIGNGNSKISPALHVTPPSPCMPPLVPPPSSNVSSDSFDTIKAGPLSASTVSPSSTPLLSSSSSSSTLLSRKRAMSHDSASTYNHVIVYAPVLMSIEEAQQLGGREAVIAPSANSSALCSSPTAYSSSTSPRLRGHSPPMPSSSTQAENSSHLHHLHHHHQHGHGHGSSHHQHHHHNQQHQQHYTPSMRQSYAHPQNWSTNEKRDLHVPVSAPSRSDSASSISTITPAAERTPVITVNSNPFGAIKGYRDTTEMNELASTTKTV